MGTTSTLGGLYPDWPQYAARLADAVRALDADTLALRPFPDHMPLWGLAAHVAGGRVYWLCAVCGEPGADRTPFPHPDGQGWEDDESHPRTGDELGWALDSSFGVVADCLARWSPADLATPVERTYGGVTQVHNRASILNRLFTHDAFHAGEISLLLGERGLPGIDLWRRHAPGA